MALSAAHKFLPGTVGRVPPTSRGQRQPTSQHKHPLPQKNEAAHQLFDELCVANTFQGIMNTFQQLCDVLELKPSEHTSFYTKLKTCLHSWKAQGLWSKLDKRASHKEYRKGTCCSNTRVLIIGAGPCGLRTAIELALLGAKTVIVEKRDRFSRNAVLHLWPFLITDLKMLGAKKFFGKFCAGSIDHISIRTLQCILLKAALLLGVEVHACVSFEGLREPPADQENERVGWRANVSPADHPVSQYEFDVLIGADGKRNTLPGFKRKEFRGKLAIAITANFINNHTQAEARVEEISGVAFIFNQKFFKDLYEKTGVDLENIVYYKDETHYFVMTAKKASLLEKGVLYQDYADTAALLAKDNVCQEALLEYACQAADVSTNHQLPSLNYAHNHYGQPDVAMFDFTSLYAAEQASSVCDRNGHKLLMALVGDSLLEPFWPTGSGCARGFLGALDAAWMVRSWASGTRTPLEVMAERESIYQLLSQTAPESMPKAYSSYTIDPCTRYTNLNTQHFNPYQMRGQFDSDDKKYTDQIVHIAEKSNRYDYLRDSHYLLKWLQKQLELYASRVAPTDLAASWRSGLALCALIHKYRPELVDFDNLDEENVIGNNQMAFDIAEKEFGITPVMSASDLQASDVPDQLTIVSYLSQFYDYFRKESSAPPAKIARSSDKAFRAPRTQSPSSRLTLLSKLSQRARQRREQKQPGPADDSDTDSVCSDDRQPAHLSTRKRLKQGAGVLDNYMRYEYGKQEPPSKLTQVKKDMRLPPDPGVRGKNKVSVLAKNLAAEWGIPIQREDKTADTGDKIIVLPERDLPVAKPLILGEAARADQCYFCHERVYLVERYSAEGVFFHRGCLRCDYCNTNLRIGQYSFQRADTGEAKFYCFQHVGLTKPSYKTRKRIHDNELPKFTDVPSNDSIDHAPVAMRARPTRRSSVKGGQIKVTPERVEFVTESEMEESEYETALHNRTESVLGTSSSDENTDSSSEEWQFSGSGSDDNQSLAELARAYRKQLARTTQKYTRRRKRRCTPHSDSDGDEGSESECSTGSETAQESDASDADWELEDSETEKESEGETTDDDSDKKKVFNLSCSPPSYPASHYFSNRYKAQLTRPTSLRTYKADKHQESMDAKFAERLYGIKSPTTCMAETTAAATTTSTATTMLASLQPKKSAEEKHVSPTSQQINKSRLNFFSAPSEPVRIDAKDFLGLRTPVKEKKPVEELAEVEEKEETSSDKASENHSDAAGENSEEEGSVSTSEVVKESDSQLTDEDTMLDGNEDLKSTSGDSSELSELEEDGSGTYTGSSDERPLILPHQVPDIQIHEASEASSNHQSTESLDKPEQEVCKVEIDEASKSESSSDSKDEEDVLKPSKEDGIKSEDSKNEVIVKAAPECEPLPAESDEEKLLLESPKDENCGAVLMGDDVAQNAAFQKPLVDMHAVEPLAIKPIHDARQSVESLSSGFTTESDTLSDSDVERRMKDMVVPEIRVAVDLDKDIDTMEGQQSENSSSDAGRVDTHKLSDSDDATVTVTSHTQDTVQSKKDKDSSTSANETDVDGMSMDWDHRDLDNLTLQQRASTSDDSYTVESSSKSSPGEVGSSEEEPIHQSDSSGENVVIADYMGGEAIDFEEIVHGRKESIASHNSIEGDRSLEGLNDQNKDSFVASDDEVKPQVKQIIEKSESEHDIDTSCQPSVEQSDIPNSISSDAVADLSRTQLGIEGLDTMSIDSKDLAMVTGNAPLAVFTPSSDELDLHDSVSVVTGDDDNAAVQCLDVSPPDMKVSEESLYDNVPSSNGDEIPIAKSFASNDYAVEQKSRIDVNEPINLPFLSQTDPWDRYMKRDKSKLPQQQAVIERSLRRSVSSPEKEVQPIATPKLLRTVSKDGDNNDVHQLTEESVVTPVPEPCKTDPLQRIDDLISSNHAASVSTEGTSATLPKGQEPPPLPQLEELLGTSLPKSRKKHREIESNTAKAINSPDSFIDEKFVTTRRSKKRAKKKKKHRRRSSSSERSLAELEQVTHKDLNGSEIVHASKDKYKTASFDNLVDDLYSIGRELSVSIDLLADGSALDDGLSIDGLLQDNLSSSMELLDNVSLKNKVNSDDSILKKHGADLIEAADQSLESSVYYTPDISIHDASPTSGNSKRPPPLNTKCTNVEKTEENLDSLGNETPLYSPSKNLMDAKRRFFTESPQPVRIDPFMVIGPLRYKDKENNHISSQNGHTNNQNDNAPKKPSKDGMKTWHSVDAQSTSPSTKRKHDGGDDKPKMMLKMESHSVDVPSSVVSPTAGIPHTDAANGDGDVFYSPAAAQPPLTPVEIKRIKDAELVDAKQAAKMRARAMNDEQLGITESPVRGTDGKGKESSRGRDRVKSAPTSKAKDGGKKGSLGAFPSPTFSKRRDKSKSLDRKVFTGKKDSSSKDNANAQIEKKRQSLLSKLLPGKRDKSTKRTSTSGTMSGGSTTGTSSSDRSTKTPNSDRKFMRSKSKAKTANLRAVEKEMMQMEKRASKYDEFAAMAEDIAGLEEKSARSPPLQPQDPLGQKKDIMEKLKGLVPQKEPEQSRLAPKATVDEFDTESEFGDSTSVRSFRMQQPMTDEEMSRVLRKQQKALQKRQREEQLKRLRAAQQIQRELEEIENKQKELEDQGVVIEQALRQQSPDSTLDPQGGDEGLMQEWFKVVYEKNQLLRHESELMVQAKELELEDRQSRLEQRLRELISAQGNTASGAAPETSAEEQRTMEELLEVIEQRDALVSMLEEDRQSSDRRHHSASATLQSSGDDAPQLSLGFRAEESKA